MSEERSERKFNSRNLRRFQDKLIRVNYKTFRDESWYFESTTGVLLNRSRKGAKIKFMNEDPILTIPYERLLSVEFPYINKYKDEPT